MSLLSVRDLTVSFPTSDGVVRAVRGLSFDVEPGQTLGIVGETGSGKSVTALSLLGLNPGADISGSAVFEETDLLTMGQDAIRRVRGAKIAMIFQDPLSSLHPYYRVGWQISEAIRAHTRMSRDQAMRQAVELLRLVSIPQPERRVQAFPHELSGGMRQRAMIAMALALRPKLLIADEPTTALDATVQAQLMELLGGMQRELGMAMIVITHDLGLVATVADRVLVMYAGRGAENADYRTIFRSPHHPYTRGLLASIPGAAGSGGRLIPIVGQPPSLIRIPSGCAFHPRCPFAMDVCVREQPPSAPVRDGEGHWSACWLPPEAVGISPSADADRERYVKNRQGPAVSRLRDARSSRSGGDVVYT
ncbi:MAG: ABC transporter ATP-binding protein [Candidatus Dormibacteria bacterium]|jgi:oligopeptide/dipeptide ABC transporter ATP-binding protein